MKLIDKAAVVAEINRLIAELVEESEGTMFEQGRISAFEDAKLFLDTLEMKEVDFKKEIEEYLSIYWPNEKNLHPFLGHVAKHFFELGLLHSIDESVIRKIIDLYFEAVKHYDEVIKQERN